jgi:hypothetical protein
MDLHGILFKHVGHTTCGGRDAGTTGKPQVLPGSSALLTVSGGEKWTSGYAYGRPRQ